MPSYIPGEFQEWQVRVIEECRGLNENITKLYAFLTKPREETNIPDEPFNLMLKQHTAMCTYRDILRERIGLFF